MKRFIRYLYEYEQGKRMRNVGFVKVEQGEEECMVHIHGKGLRMGRDTSLQIYLLFEDEGKCFGIWKGEADNINPAVNTCISYTAEDIGLPEIYSKIDGVALQNKDGRLYTALWDEKMMDLAHMQVWNPKKAESTEAAGEMKEAQEVQAVNDTPSVKNVQNARDMQTPQDIQTDEKPKKRQEYTVMETPETADGMPETGEEMPGPEMPDGIETEEIISGPEANDASEVLDDEIPAIRSEGLFFMENPGNLQSPQRWRTRKIQRTELARLARCEWRLANNNFLLHGYYNYHHLILLEKGEQLMLGVPGIYHEKEAAAAGAFGFPEFIERDSLNVNLSPDEYNEEQPFGYWCRPVKRAFKWEQG